MAELSFTENNLKYYLLISYLKTKQIKVIVILPVILYGCDMWSLGLRENLNLHSLRTGC
jgi:hypothetical protein